MHKKIVILLIMYLSFSTEMRSSSQAVFSTENDWVSGTPTDYVTTGQTDALRLSTGFFPAFDDFNSIRGWWTNYSTTLQSPGVIRHSATLTTPGQKIGLFTSSISPSFDFETTVWANIGCSGCFDGGFGIEAGNQKAQIQLQGSNVSFPGGTGGVGTASIGTGWKQLRIRKSDQIYLADVRTSTTASWIFLGATYLTPAAQAIYIGQYYYITSVYAMEYSSFELKPLAQQGYWSSASKYLSGTPTTVGTIKWSQNTPAGTKIELQTSTSDDGTNWSNWSPVYTDSFGSPITSPSRPYIRVAATLYSDANRDNSPVLKDITIDYPDAVPTVPVISSSSHSAGLWSSKKQVDLAWSMSGSNPAPESSYKYWLAVNGALTATGSVSLTPSSVGQPHPLSLLLPQEGSYAFGLTVTADAFSGGETNTAAPLLFNYDATPPSQVQISSPTHPPLLFTNNNSPIFKLHATDAVSGISGYAAVLDKAETGDPGNIVNSGEELRMSKLDNGTYYLHARAIDMAGNTGPVSHYGIRIDFNGALLSLDYVKALPNPVRGNMAKLEYELAAAATSVTLEFLNSQGELLKTEDGSKIVGKNYYNWDVSGLANGIYLFRVKATSSEDGKSYSVIRKVAVLR